MRVRPVVIPHPAGELPEVRGLLLGQRDGGGKLDHLLLPHRTEQFLLAAEVLVDPLLVDPGTGGNVVHPCAQRAVLAVLEDRGVQFLDRLADNLVFTVTGTSPLAGRYTSKAEYCETPRSRSPSS